MSGKQIRKCILLLCFLLMCFSCGSNVFAATVARIGSRSYSSLQSAVNAAKNGQTIKVTRPISTKKMLTISGKKSITIDFGNNKYSMTNSDTYAFDVNVTKLTIKNAKINSARGAIFVEKKSKAVITNGSITGITYNEGTLEVKNGKFEGRGYNQSGELEMPAFDNFGTITIYNATVKGSGRDALWNIGKAYIYNGTFSTTKSDCIYNDENGIMKISGGSFNHTIKDDYSYLIGNYGEMIISKGSFKGYIRNESNKRMVINGGTFRGHQGWLVLRNVKGNVSITGGSFSTTRNNVLYNNAGATFTISGGGFTTKNENDFPALYSEGTISVTGGTFKLNGKLSKSICVTSNSYWYITSNVQYGFVKKEV